MPTRLVGCCRTSFCFVYGQSLTIENFSYLLISSLRFHQDWSQVHRIFHQTFPIGASWDRGKLIGFRIQKGQGHTVTKCAKKYHFWSFFMQYLRYALMDFDFIASASSDKGQKVKGEGPSMTKDPAGGGTQLDTQGLIYE